MVHVVYKEYESAAAGGRSFLLNSLFHDHHSTYISIRVL